MTRPILVYSFVALLSAGSAAAASPACLRSRDIESSSSKDGTTMIFRMRDGRVYLNHLRGSCPGLKFNGFAWVLRGGDDEVCENQQTLRVLQSGEICSLGKFDPAVHR